jgi:CRP-like cAMP-binding protein
MAIRSDRPKSGNLLLARLPAAELASILARCQAVPLTKRLALLDRDQVISHVYFPDGGVCSLTTSMDDGDTVEVLTVGREGMVGFELFMGSPRASVDAFVQVPGGVAQRLPVDAFRREMDKKGHLFRTLSIYVQAVLGQIVQTAACNRLHDSRQRCARWLLLTHDRLDSDEFLLSHEFLSCTLGVQRSTVTIIAGGLQRAGLIRYVHGRVTIVDRAGLEEVACECYQVGARQFAGLGLYLRKGPVAADGGVSGIRQNARRREA